MLSAPDGTGRDQPAADLLGQLCHDMRVMWTLAGGPTLQALGKSVGLSKSQVGAILHGDIRRPPDWEITKGLLLRVREFAEQHGRAETLPFKTGIDEYWRPRYHLVQQAYLLPIPARTPRRRRVDPVSAAPCLLPPAIADFAGREPQVSRVADLLIAAAGTGTPMAVPIVAIAGRAGIGKTTLAVHVAHLVRAGFPDGQLYVDLRGDGEPVSPAGVLARFLGVLGVDPETMPDGLAARQDMFRQRLAQRRCLVVLDNARDEAQLEPLLPGTGSCAVLVTSRYRLTALPGTTLVELDALATATALDMLSAIVGQRRLRAEQGAAVRLVGLCGGLPLAVRVAGARLAAKTHWSIAQLADRLADERLRLDELTYRHLEVRASIALSYNEVDPAAQRMLRLLGLVDVADVASWVAARLSGTSLAEAEETLERLVDAQLADIAGVDQTGQTRYRLHDLIRLFARERAYREESEQDRAAALERTLGSWLGIIELVSDMAGSYLWPKGDAPRTYPEPRLAESLTIDPLCWFDAERLNIPSVIRLAAGAPNPDLCWELALATSNLYNVRNDLQAAIACLEWGLAHARKAGNQHAQTMLLIQIGQFEYTRQRLERAAAALAEAQSLAEGLSAPRLSGLILLSLGTLSQFQARYADSLTFYGRAHELLGAIDDPIDMETTRGIGSVRLRLGHPEQAEPYLAEAMAFARGFGNVRVLRSTLFAWGELRLQQGRLDEADDAFSEILRLKAIRDELKHQVRALYGLGRVRVRQGRGRVAAKMLSRAASIAAEIGMVLLEAGALASLADACVQFGQTNEALASADKAVGLARDVGAPHFAALAVMAKAGVLAAAGREPEGRARLKEADEILAALGVSVSLPSWAGAGL